MKKRYNKRLLFILILFISIGFAYLTRDLSLSGISSIFGQSWDVHLENIEVKEGSVNANEPIIDSNRTSVTFSVELDIPGDFYEFNIDAVNAGSIDAMLDTYASTNLTEDQQKYLEYTVTYLDGEELAQYQELNSGDTLTYKIRIEYKLDITEDDLPDKNESVELTFTVDFIQADENRIKRRAENTLYNVLKNEAESGGLAKKYMGDHQDSMDASKSTRDIYHWYASNDTDGTTIKNKNNVIFANHCWQMIRTTDTGGARLLYNGEVENNKCLDTRGTHVGYNGYTNKYLSNNYYYGTDYTYDSTNKVFSISGDIEQIIWSASTYEDLIDKYTCMKTTQNETCSEIYLIESYYNNNMANVIPINSNSHYSQLGSTIFNSKRTSISNVGFMYNKEYNSSYKTVDIYNQINIYPKPLNINVWYADEIRVNDFNSTYTLINPFQISSADEYENVIGKYTTDYTYENAQSSYAYYIVDATSTSYISMQLYDGRSMDYYNNKFIYGDSYSDNGDGTYTINNYNTFYAKDYYNIVSNGASSIKNKFGCINSENNTCTNVIRIYRSNLYVLRYFTMNYNYKFSNGFNYINGKYILNDNSISIWDYSNNTSLRNYHYTCFNSTGECDEINYVFYQINNDVERLYYITLSDGEDIETALSNMLNTNDINSNSSTIKKILEDFYKKNISNYSKYIEDSIYCNDREVYSYGGFNKDGGSLTIDISFRHNNLFCQQDTDRFSINNNKAKLKYPLALIYDNDIQIMNQYKEILGNSKSYWTMTPRDYDDDGASEEIINSNGEITYTGVTNSEGIRPYISLSPTTFYTSGDGSMENPYVIYTE